MPQIIPPANLVREEKLYIVTGVEEHVVAFVFVRANFPRSRSIRVLLQRVHVRPKQQFRRIPIRDKVLAELVLSQATQFLSQRRFLKDEFDDRYFVEEDQNDPRSGYGPLQCAHRDKVQQAFVFRAPP